MKLDNRSTYMSVDNAITIYELPSADKRRRSPASDVTGGATISQLVFAAISAVRTCGFKQFRRDS